MNSLIKMVVLLLLPLVMLRAQSQQERYQASVKAYEAKDYASYLEQTKILDSLRPLHPTYTYNLASAYALTGNETMAVQTLKRLLLMNSTVNFEQDADFASLKTAGRFEELEKLKAIQNTILTNSQKVVTLSEKELHPEGLTYLAKTNSWLVTSIRKRKLVAFDRYTGQCTDWLATPDMLAVFAAKADAKEQYLWVATAALPEMEGYNKALQGKSEILKVKIATRQIVKRFPMEGNHVFGDLIVTKNNIVYVSDSGSPAIYAIENDQMTPWLSLANEAYNLQGITQNADGSKLFIADYLKGILCISLKDKFRHWLPFPEGTSPKGIDGLVYENNSLIAIQNGVKPIRIVQFRLNTIQEAISSFALLDNNRPEFNEPAQVIVVGGKTYFFANCPWNAYDQDGRLDSAKYENPELFSGVLKP